jgi:antitoxin component YwqK of YwqJK toxin-antitoxin module
VLLYSGPLDKRSQRQGDGTDFYPNGNKKYVGHFKNNLYHGTGLLYSVGGLLMYRGRFRHSQAHGQGTTYWPNGRPKFIGSHSTGRIHGEAILYRENGKTEHTGTFKDNMKHGFGTL